MWRQAAGGVSDGFRGDTAGGSGVGGGGDGGGCTIVSVVDRMCQVYLRAYPVHACACKNDDRSHHYKKDTALWDTQSF